MAAIGKEIIEQLEEHKMTDIAFLESQNNQLIHIVESDVLTEYQNVVINMQIEFNDAFIAEKNKDIENLLLLHRYNDNGAMLMPSISNPK